MVADQVRALSAETHAATDSIKELTQGLQSQADTVARAMTEGQAKSQDCVQLARHSEQAFAHIALEMQEVVQASRHISEATHEQHDVAASITQNVHRLSDDVTEVSRIAVQSATGSQAVSTKAISMAAAVQAFAA